MDNTAPSGSTNLSDALGQVLDVFDNGISQGIFADDFDREILLLSGGQPNELIIFGEAFLLVGFGDWTTVSLPGNSVEGNAVLAALGDLGLLRQRRA